MLGFRVVALGAVLLCACSTEPQPIARTTQAVKGGPWRVVASSPPQLEAHTTTILNDTKLLLVGGLNGLEVASDRVFLLNFDPSKHDLLTVPAGKLVVARTGHTTTKLSNGKLLVVGGDDVARASAELVDPMSGMSSLAAPMTDPRSHHVAALLPDGKVLVAGGVNGVSELASSELFDPATSSWSPGPNMTVGRGFASATTLADGRVLVAGGARGTSDIYDPSTKDFQRAGALAEIRVHHAAVLLPSGKVLVAGGYIKPPPGAEVTKSAEIFDPATRTWTKIADMPTPRGNATATVLENGLVMIAGGRVELTPLNYVDFFDEKTGKWSSGSPMFLPHAQHTANLMPNGDVVVMGSANSEVFSAVPIGNACDQSPDCADGFCVDGVCCATACTGSCERCDTSGARGTCKAVSGAFNHCAPGNTCIQNECVASAGTTCAPDKLSVLDKDGKASTCAPFVCDNSVGVCLTRCTSSVDCAPGSVCNAGNGQCSTPQAAGDDGGCSSSPGAPSGHLVVLALIAAVMALGAHRSHRRW